MARCSECHTPTPGNVTRTAPYMHYGAFAQLREPVAFYDKGRGHAVPKAMRLYRYITDSHLTEAEIE